MVWAFPDPGASVPCASYIAVKMQKDTLRRIGTKEITAAVSRSDSDESRKVEIETPQEESRKDYKDKNKPNSIGIELRNSNISGVFWGGHSVIS